MRPGLVATISTTIVALLLSTLLYGS
jgi:hypothetical protein